MKHYLPSRLASNEISILLVGAGGTGSRMLEHLMNLHRAMLALGHPHGLNVTVMDDDRVSQANVGRQAFYPCDVNRYKAITLVNRANMAMEFSKPWMAEVERLTPRYRHIQKFNMVIGAVDTRSARAAILGALKAATYGKRYWLDLGNRSSDGQVILGEVDSNSKPSTINEQWRLPHAGELFPELVNSELDSIEDETPSCSLAEALEKQSLFINPAVSLAASNLLWQLFTKGEIENHGAFVNLDQMTMLPMAIDHEVWARFGIKRRKPATKRTKKVPQDTQPA